MTSAARPAPRDNARARAATRLLQQPHARIDELWREVAAVGRDVERICQADRTALRVLSALAV